MDWEAYFRSQRGVGFGARHHAAPAAAPAKSRIMHRGKSISARQGEAGLQASVAAIRAQSAPTSQSSAQRAKRSTPTGQSDSGGGGGGGGGGGNGSSNGTGPGDTDDDSPDYDNDDDGGDDDGDEIGFGTLGGLYTVAELKDLIAAKDATMRNLARDFTEVSHLPFDFTQLLPAYTALVNRYQAARAIAQKLVDDASASGWSWKYGIRPTNMIVADAEYKGLLASLNPRWAEHTWASGDGSLDDISDQLQKFGATGKDAEPIPQPSKGSDTDLTAYQKSDAAIKAGEKAATFFDTTHLIVYALVGGAIVLFVLPRLMGMTPAAMIARRF